MSMANVVRINNFILFILVTGVVVDNIVALEIVKMGKDDLRYYLVEIRRGMNMHWNKKRVDPEGKIEILEAIKAAKEWMDVHPNATYAEYERKFTELESLRSSKSYVRHGSLDFLIEVMRATIKNQIQWPAELESQHIETITRTLDVAQQWWDRHGLEASDEEYDDMYNMVDLILTPFHAVGYDI